MTNSISNTADLNAALSTLRGSQAQLRTAHLFALTVPPHLTGARKTRAVELCDKIADALAHCERMLFVVTGDLHAEQA